MGGQKRAAESSIYEVLQRLNASGGDLGKAAGAQYDPVLVCIGGVCYAISDGAIGAGAPVKLSAGTSGQVTAATAGTDAGSILGYALEPATNAGDIVRVLVALA